MSATSWVFFCGLVLGLIGLYPLLRLLPRRRAMNLLRRGTALSPAELQELYRRTEPAKTGKLRLGVVCAGHVGGNSLLHTPVGNTPCATYAVNVNHVEGPSQGHGKQVYTKTAQGDFALEQDGSSIPVHLDERSLISPQLLRPVYNEFQKDAPNLPLSQHNIKAFYGYRVREEALVAGDSLYLCGELNDRRSAPMVSAPLRGGNLLLSSLPPAEWLVKLGAEQREDWVSALFLCACGILFVSEALSPGGWGLPSNFPPALLMFLAGILLIAGRIAAGAGALSLSPRKRTTASWLGAGLVFATIYSAANPPPEDVPAQAKSRPAPTTPAQPPPAMAKEQAGERLVAVDDFSVQTGLWRKEPIENERGKGLHEWHQGRLHIEVYFKEDNDITRLFSSVARGVKVGAHYRVAVEAQPVSYQGNAQKVFYGLYFRTDDDEGYYFLINKYSGEATLRKHKGEDWSTPIKRREAPQIKEEGLNRLEVTVSNGEAVLSINRHEFERLTLERPGTEGVVGLGVQTNRHVPKIRVEFDNFSLYKLD